ncbi:MULTISPECIES: formate dehydrogenase accessory sulfurtransferase FdhD [unclassified Pseudactinotalea]|uniref:formate dehydrogenase accessory sulfurtransferase FdhD n=1 Tax=unclassified Pseudactinotalea TaxID=2649176 RepID=UPI00128AEEE0|nr:MULTISPECIES: formate dehydrogenase accessory sulfurtransferase FdhD [unclassified Pseudactinotalea]MPV50465.1 formate dehydrogenase accessory sulfurtransferase FdhD [Pseudactinotalea sp. HY160]QGH70512.1 formate dehydrogenase accessory sulfurtransferase FdhD [Pseudactinotalea sp. HY158]
MGRITTRRRIRRITGSDTRSRQDSLVVEEPLEIRLAGRPLAVTMRTPGHDVELAAGFLTSEGIIWRAHDLLTAIHCGGPGSGGGENTYNVLDIALAPHVPPPPASSERSFYTTSSCGVCGKASIEAIATISKFSVAGDPAAMSAAEVRALPERLRAQQEVFAKTGGLHAAGLFDAATGELLVVREDVGRHNAVDKVIGWALLAGRLPLAGTVLQVSGRASFELVQKATMAGVPMLTAVSAASSLAVDLAEEAGLTLVGFMRGESMNVYTHPDRIR